jgi:chromosome partitioning protein
MARTLVIANQKGGIGKSTSAANIGRALSEKGKRVLLIDLDPQGGMSANFGVNSFEVKRSTYAILMKQDVALVKILQPVKPLLALAPASIDLSNAEIMLATKPDGPLRLKKALEKNRIPFDFILIDTPPTLGLLTVNGMVAADELLIPIQDQYLAMRGVRSVLDTQDRIVNTGMNPNLKLGGVFATMYRDEMESAQEAVAEMKDVFGNKMFDTRIPYDNIIAEAPAAGESLLDFAPEHPAAHAYRSLAEEILTHG